MGTNKAFFGCYCLLFCPFFTSPLALLLYLSLRLPYCCCSIYYKVSLANWVDLFLRSSYCLSFFNCISDTVFFSRTLRFSQLRLIFLWVSTFLAPSSPPSDFSPAGVVVECHQKGFVYHHSGIHLLFHRCRALSATRKDARTAGILEELDAIHCSEKLYSVWELQIQNNI